MRDGSRITALPANPATARGYSANIFLDEFALHADAQAIWRAIYPLITNPLRGELELRVLSTPNGQGNRFHQLWVESQEAGSRWSAHRTTIHDAVAAGLAVDIEEMRGAAGDAATWEQQFGCVFLDEGGVLFPYEMIAGAESERAVVDFPEPVPGGPLCCGIDIGTAHDATVAVTLRREDGRFAVCEVLHLRGVALAGLQARA